MMLSLNVSQAMGIKQDNIEIADSTQSREYNIMIQVRGREITGLCLMEVASDNSVVGTIVNEMGVKAFDFTYNNGKAKILNVLGPLNKWYIRKVLKNDFKFIIENIWKEGDAVKKKRTLTHLSNGDIDVNNRRFKIHYLLTPMKSEL